MSEPNEQLCSDNDNHVSENLRSLVSTDDENDGSGNIVYPQFNESAGFDEVSLELGWSLLPSTSLKMLSRITHSPGKANYMGEEALDKGKGNLQV